MIRVLIVDDEPLVRLALRSLEDWAGNGVEISAEASDGAAALAVLEADPGIDVVVADVDMPVMDGLELAERLAARGAPQGVLFLSSYDTFAYARRAFKAGAGDYILKGEMDEGRLLAALKRVAEGLASRRGGEARGAAAPERPRDERTAAFFSRLLAGDAGGADAAARDLSLRVRLPAALLLARPADPRLVAERYGDDPTALERVAADLMRQCLISRSSGEAFAVSFERYLALFDSAEDADSFFEEFSRSARNYLALDFEARPGPAIASWAELRDSYAQAESRFSGSSRLVVRARRFIRERYADPDLDLAAIAAYAEVSKNHLSWEFARETGENLTAFIARTRVEAAKKLLEETAFKTYEIAERVGFTNTETFCRTFKKVTGTTPRGFSM